MKRNILKEENVLIIEETNPINTIVHFQLKDHDKTLAWADISTAGDIWTFTRIFVTEDNRARGYGTELLVKLIEYLDRHKIDLYAYIYSSGSLSEKHLDAWYRRYGFVDAADKGFPLARYAEGHIQNRGIQ